MNPIEQAIENIWRKRPAMSASNVEMTAVSKDELREAFEGFAGNIIERVVDYMSHDVKLKSEEQRKHAVGMYVEHILSDQFDWKGARKHL